MDGKKIVLIVGALIIAIGAAFGVNLMMRGSGAPTSQAAAAPSLDGPEVLVATRALPVGTIITPESIRFQAWPKDLANGQHYFLKEGTDIQSLAGTVVRNPITAGEPLTQGALVKPGERGFLAAALGPGMRAVTVSVSAESGVAGFVFPGDRVDLALTQTFEVEDSNLPLHVTDTIVRNLRVLATDQRTTSKNDDGKDEVRTFATVTLETTPRIAEKIAVSQAMGKLSLALRPLADDTAELERAIAAGDIEVPKDGDLDGDKRLLLKIASRPIDTGTTSTTGGEVSRYARSTRGIAIKVPASGLERGGSAPSGSMPQNNGPVRPSGPTIRVTRGDQVVEVPVGGN